MSTAEKIWQAFTQVIKLTDKVSSLSGQVKELSSDIRAMDKRIVRLETALEIALSGRAIAKTHYLSQTAAEKSQRLITQRRKDLR
jgi:predicted  nucleic acid-binding Zn-ribbon protein